MMFMPWFSGSRCRAIGTAAVAALAIALPAMASEDPIDLRAVTTWSAPAVSAVPTATNRISDQTLRQIAHVSIPGDQVRVKFSNRYGSAPLVIGAASISLRAADENIVPGSTRALTFSGNTTFTIPAGAELMSDWVDFALPALSDVAVDLYLPGDTGTDPVGSLLTVFNGAMQTNYVSQTGNHVGSTAFPVASTRLAWSFMFAINTRAAQPTGTVVAFGDSITQGLRSTNNTNRRWPDVLARRIIAANAGKEVGVANVGISGNRVWVGGTTTNPSAMARFDRDALVQTGATHVIVLLGINDISGGATAQQVITALRQLVVRAHSRGLKIYGGTLTPFGNAPDVRENHRLAVNDWIRTTSEYDGVIDFDAAIRDPANPRRMLPIYDSGDSLHPSDAGYEAMGNAIDLALLDVVRTIPRALLPAIDVRVVPEVVNLRTTAGLVTAVINATDGTNLTQWGIADVRGEGAPAFSTGISSDGQSYVVTFRKSDLASLPAGDAVTFTVTGAFNRNGEQATLAGSAVVRVLR